MRVRYLGPRQFITVAGFGVHVAGQWTDYPEEVARELVETGVRQRFELEAPAATDAPKGQSNPSKTKRAKRRAPRENQ